MLNFQPNWNLPPSQPALMLNNARGETAARLASFRNTFASRRCIVPDDTFYEWKRDGKLKQLFAIARVDGAPLAFGGIRESWTNRATGDITRSFAIVTTSANGTMAPIHDRMPVIL